MSILIVLDEGQSARLSERESARNVGATSASDAARMRANVGLLFGSPLFCQSGDELGDDLTAWIRSGEPGEHVSFRLAPINGRAVLAR